MIGCLTWGRLNSQRIPRKLLEEINGRTLLDRGLTYIRRLCDLTGAIPILATAKSEMDIAAAAQAAGVVVVYASDSCTQTEDYNSQIQPLRCQLEALNITRLWVNNCLCHPFSRLDTGAAIMRLAAQHMQEYVLTLARRGIIWDERGSVISGQLQHANTKTNPLYHRLSHFGYVTSLDFLSEPEELMAPRIVPYPIDLRWYERIDIDTYDDLELARAAAYTADKLCAESAASPVPMFGDAGVSRGM